MQIITTDDILGGSESDRLNKLQKENPWLDRDLLVDVYLILKGGSVSYTPDEELLKDLSRSDPEYWDARMDLGSRRVFLEGLAKSQHMDRLIALGDAHKGLLEFIESMKRAFTARAEYVKKLGPIDYSSGGSPISYTSEEELDRVATERANNPEMGFDKYMDDLLTEFKALEDPALRQFYSGCGTVSYFDATQNEGGTLSNAAIRQGCALPLSYPVLFNWYTKIVDDLGVKKLKDKDSDDQKNKKKEDVLDDLDKVQSADPADVGKEDFEAKVAMKSLDITKNIESEEGNCHLFVLLDVSGSMMTADVGGSICRAFAANVVTLGLLNFAMKDNYVVHVVPFAGNVSGDTRTANDRDSALSAMRWLGGRSYDGGGTNISHAILHAYARLQEDPKYRKCDIVLITDGASNISSEVVDRKPRNTKLRTILCAKDIFSFYKRHAERLRDASDSWANMSWDKGTNSLSVADVLKGINDIHSND